MQAPDDAQVYATSDKDYVYVMMAFVNESDQVAEVTPSTFQAIGPRSGHEIIPAEKVEKKLRKKVRNYRIAMALVAAIPSDEPDESQAIARDANDNARMMERRNAEKTQFLLKRHTVLPGETYRGEVWIRIKKKGPFTIYVPFAEEMHEFAYVVR